MAVLLPKWDAVGLLTKPAFGFRRPLFPGLTNRPGRSPVQRQEKDSYGETIPTGDQCAVPAHGGDSKSCGVRSPMLEWRAWPIRATPGIRSGIGKTALLL